MAAPKWRIAMAADDAGVGYKNKIKADFESDPRVESVIDVGSLTVDDKTAYPLRAAAAAQLVADGTVAGTSRKIGGTRCFACLLACRMRVK
ncbi:hypothetical protein NUW58_g10291 [Xylaria curta]|uniref:Uncharacterized protein n=1 Tax=Xylaria curta TaxID=42375 RepID=A0ACC1MN95_9PEZI|nr:hypothetical protein NUW58_g10291 [Xylaria curta]